MILDILIPPQVLPAHPPVNKMTISIIFEKEGQRLKSTVANPVVEIMDATVKDEWFIAWPILSYICAVLRVIRSIATATMPRKHLTSALSDSLKRPLRIR